MLNVATPLSSQPFHRNTELAVRMLMDGRTLPQERGCEAIETIAEVAGFSRV